jgi:hypothetical protein
LTLTARDTNNATATRVFTVNVLTANTVPQISNIADQSANEDAAPLTLSFVVQDLETPADLLTVSGTSSNPLLVPPSSIGFGGAGSNRTVTVTLSPDQSGTATITVRVRDAEGLSSADSFVLTVNAANDPPVLSSSPAQTIDEDQVLTVALAIADRETALDSLGLSGSGSDTNLVPNGAITFSGSGANRLLSLTPGSHRSGTTTVAIVLSDGAAAVTNTFSLVIRPVNTPPTLNALNNLALTEDPVPQSVNLSGISSGAADEGQTLVVTASSSNPALIPTPSVTYTSPNPTGSLNFTVAPSASGTALLSVTVNDGGASNNVFSRTFTVTVAYQQ